MNKKKPLCVAFATDENYVQHMCVAMLSLLHNQHNDTRIHVFVLGDNLSGDSIAIIKALAEDHNALITIENVDFEAFTRGLDPKRHQSRVTYATLVIPHILKTDKVLYLDCDLLVRDDISPLWEVDISKHYLGAVIDAFLGGINGRQLVDSRLGIPEGYKFFNAGVLMMNLEKWRRNMDMIDRALQFKIDNPDTHGNDQDALNATLWGKWQPLHPRWNVQRYTFRLCYDRKLRKIAPKEIVDAVKNPAIVHYTSAVKPWHYECRVPYVEEYYKYLAETPWRDYLPPKRISEVIIKNIKMARRRLTGAALGYRV